MLTKKELNAICEYFKKINKSNSEQKYTNYDSMVNSWILCNQRSKLQFSDFKMYDYTTLINENE